MKFPKDSMDTYFQHGVDLTNRRVFIGDIDSDNVGTAIKALYLMETESSNLPCELFISSNGGDVYEALGLYDVIQTIRCPVSTFAFGKCLSAAPLLLAAGEPGQRWVAQHAAFMHHAWWADMNGKEPELETAIKHHKSVDTAWLRLLEKHSNRDFRFWKRKARLASDFYFTAEEAIDFGLADAIWSEKG